MYVENIAVNRLFLIIVFCYFPLPFTNCIGLCKETIPNFNQEDCETNKETHGQICSPV